MSDQPTDRRVVISYEGAGKFVGLYEPLSDGQMMLVASHNAIEGPEPLVMGLADEIERLRAVIRRAAQDLYTAEVHRQGIGWDDYCTTLLTRTQHALAAETNRNRS